MRHIYSPNVIAYIMACTDLKPEMGLEMVDGKLVGYAEFPKIDAIDACIKAYHRNSFIRKFVSSYKEIKEEIWRLKNEA